AEFLLAPSAQMGGWGNAVKAYLDMAGATGASGSTGLLAGLCAEIKLPAQAMTGTFAVLELDLVAPTSFVANEGLGLNCVSFINANLSETFAYAEVDDHGYFLNVQGLDDDTTHMLYDNTLKCVIGTTKWYLPFSSAEGSYTTAYPIVSSYATRAIDITDGFFRIGAQDEGVPLVDASPYAMEIHVKTASDIATIPVDGLTYATGLSCGIRCRYEVGFDQANVISMIAIEGRLRPKKDLGDGAHAAISGTIEAS
ncbi:unnamed protein product, partial [marine sediment metagenome]